MKMKKYLDVFKKQNIAYKIVTLFIIAFMGIMLFKEKDKKEVKGVQC